MTLARQSRPKDAAEVFREVVKLRPDSSEAHLSLGVVLADASLPEQALPEFERALELAPKFPPALFYRGRALYDLRRYDEARAALVEAGQAAGRNPDVLRFLGMTLSRLGRNEEAADALRESIAMNAKSDVAHEELGRALLSLGRRDQAIASLKRAVELNPRNTAATATLLRELYRAKSDEAPEYSAKLRDLKQEESATVRAKTLSNFALQAAEAEDWPKAVGQLEQAIEACGECSILALLHKNLGLILAQSGDSARALEQLRKARKLDAQDPDIGYALTLVETSLRNP
jgi:tetratricopeptide (TPR) repeat protein